MRTRRLRPALPALVAALVGGVFALGGCGAGSSSTPLSVDQLPLVGGATVVTHVKQCDRGANAYCAVEAVIVGHGYASSGALVAAERRWLRTVGWSNMAGDNGKEHAAESAGHRVRVTYATGSGDLLGWDMGWIKRPRSIALMLSRLMFSRTPAMSVMLEAGAG